MKFSFTPKISLRHTERIDVYIHTKARGHTRKTKCENTFEHRKAYFSKTLFITFLPYAYVSH